jgi:hypothetical protein
VETGAGAAGAGDADAVGVGVGVAVGVADGDADGSGVADGDADGSGDGVVAARSAPFSNTNLEIAASAPRRVFLRDGQIERDERGIR